MPDDPVRDDPDPADPRARLAASWDANAAAWTDAVRQGRIASRDRATDAAVLAAVTRLHPRRVLDVGCGEGWLAHELESRGVSVVGFDASEALVRAAGSGPGTFVQLDYATFERDGGVIRGPFDVAVCNFSLLEHEIDGLLRAVVDRLGPAGRLVVQTLHPLALGAERYADGWHEETFDGFGGAFAAPMPWYARTLASWSRAVGGAGLAFERLEEPRMDGAPWPVSLLFTAVRRPSAAGVGGPG